MRKETAQTRDQEMEEKGVNAYLPATKEKKRGKIGRVVATALACVLFFGGGAASVWFSLDKEIRTLIKVKNTIDEEYYKEIDDEAFYDAIFDAVNGQLDDYSEYMTASEYTQSSNSLNGKHIGVGVSFYKSDIEQGKMKIAKVSGNSPADNAGLLAGDCITGFGKTPESLTLSEDYDAFVAFLDTCAEGETLYLQAQRGEENVLVSLSRQSFVENYVFYRSKTTSYGFTGKDATTLTERTDALTCLPDDTAYIRLARFGGEAVESFGIAMSVFKEEGKKNLVVDLRGNGGGYMSVMQGIASYFCKNSNERKPVAAVADYGEKEEVFKAQENYYWDYFKDESRVYILADSNSASASECLIGVMVDYGAARYEDICLVERNGVAKTYGKGIMQAYFPLNLSGDKIKLTTARVCWPVTKTCIHDRGVLPEDGAKTSAEYAVAEEELSAAISALFD